MEDYNELDETTVKPLSVERRVVLSSEKVGQEQIHGLLFGNKLSWQSIIYDLINTEQLDPWNIDICLLSNKYLEKVRTLEEANFFVSSKVLLAASLLLRIKSEILLNHLPSLDEILYGKKEEKNYIQERIEFDDEIPDLIPRTPLPRGRKVTLQELMAALGNAIKTENRRIKRVIIDKQRMMETGMVLPRKSVDLRSQINSLYGKLKNIFLEKGDERVAFSSFSGESVEDKLAHFVPLLHLDNQHKVLAEQDNHFEEIWVWLKEVYQKRHASMLDEMRRDAEQAMKEDLIQMAKEGELEKLQKKMKKGKKFKKFEKKVEEEEMEEKVIEDAE